MINASKKSGAKLAVGHVQRSYSEYREVKVVGGSDLCLYEDGKDIIRVLEEILKES